MDRPELREVIAKLRAAGVAVTTDDDLAVVVARLQARIVDVATADREAFDRGLYDQLMRLWELLADERDEDGN